MSAKAKIDLPQEGTSKAGESLPEHRSGCPTYSGGGKQLRVGGAAGGSRGQTKLGGPKVPKGIKAPKGEVEGAPGAGSGVAPSGNAPHMGRAPKRSAENPRGLVVRSEGGLNQGGGSGSVAPYSAPPEQRLPDVREALGPQGNTSGTALNAAEGGDLQGRRRRKKRSGCQRRVKAELRRQQAEDATSTADRIKRAREISGESQVLVSAKRAKTEETQSYAAALNIYKMAITAKDFPGTWLGEEEYLALQGIIFDKLEITPDPIPVVSMGNLKSGAILFRCEGESSMKWLRTLDGTAVNGVELRVVDAKNLPKPVKMAWKSRNVTRQDTGRVMRLLQRLHPSLKTSNWSIVGSTVEGMTVRRIVLMDEASAAYIKDRQYILNTGIDRSIFKLLEYDVRRGDEPVSASVTAEQRGDAVAVPEDCPRTEEQALEPIAGPSASEGLSGGTGGAGEKLVVDEPAAALSPASIGSLEAIADLDLGRSSPLEYDISADEETELGDRI
ncbi:uncharacterized protein LOC135079476 [Ostrinia nubilalis]|uniref:uncharacterized protein LOC135079476 n=2 Tax=Ostrinia nubilalis TaxID=29057 RepID=UPI0030822CB9